MRNLTGVSTNNVLSLDPFFVLKIHCMQYRPPHLPSTCLMHTLLNRIKTKVNVVVTVKSLIWVKIFQIESTGKCIPKVQFKVIDEDK